MKDFTTAHGDRIGVLVHDSGDRELLVFERGRPDDCVASVRLGPEDVRTLARTLGGSSVAGLPMGAVDGVDIETLRVGRSDSAANWPLGTLVGATGAKIVAIVRGEETVPTPDRHFVIREGDILVAVGRVGEVEGLFHRLQDG